MNKPKKIIELIQSKYRTFNHVRTRSRNDNFETFSFSKNLNGTIRIDINKEELHCKVLMEQNLVQIYLDFERKYLRNLPEGSGPIKVPYDSDLENQLITLNLPLYLNQELYTDLCKLFHAEEK